MVTMLDGCPQLPPLERRRFIRTAIFFLLSIMPFVLIQLAGHSLGRIPNVVAMVANAFSDAVSWVIGFAHTLYMGYYLRQFHNDQLSVMLLRPFGMILTPSVFAYIFVGIGPTIVF